MIGCIRAAAPYGPAVGTEDAEGFVARSTGVREPLWTRIARYPCGEHRDRELIAAAPSPRRPVRGRKRCGDPVESEA